MSRHIGLLYDVTQMQIYDHHGAGISRTLLIFWSTSEGSFEKYDKRRKILAPK